MWEFIRGSLQADELISDAGTFRLPYPSGVANFIFYSNGATR
jgi:hypothetical protein